ncbi:SNF7 family protein [Oesophagostomum dentatum]|uniref:SNF7 family protein n=1 Tax=Oesophagostomum dentatum TaxID=61180 RepID=A0A0B1TCF9_OESDE|nr:SNF7 family protein [Oesophagostomum dentatum]
MGLFGKKKDPKEQVREMQRKMRGEMRALDRQIYGIQREEQKVTREIKEAAKKGDRDVCVVLAKSLIQSRKAVAKIHVSKAQINSVIMCMQEQLATMRMAGSLQKSTQVLQAMQNLVKVDYKKAPSRVPEIMKTMREMSQEMMKLGIIDEMIEETMDNMEPADLEEAAQEEVDRILWEVTAGELGKAPAAATGELGGEQEATPDLSSMAQRLAELRD